ncbi:hypothetical protein PG993_011434 [Apiospora rasikravindrae]|uniref:Uncharacterized protein n=1 Tax=Apiospora rasikravindrae TaxID=990691 RepID=A0ABR1SE88_9PEZI
MSVFPSFEELFKTGQRPRLTPEAARLYWELQDPLADAVSVVRPDWHEKGFFEREPYIVVQETLANTADGGDAAITPHLIAAAPLTEPKISSITVRVDVLEIWEYYWREVEHMYHDEEGENPDQVFGSPPPDHDGRGGGNGRGYHAPLLRRGRADEEVEVDY